MSAEPAWFRTWLVYREALFGYPDLRIQTVSAGRGVRVHVLNNAGALVAKADVLNSWLDDRIVPWGPTEAERVAAKMVATIDSIVARAKTERKDPPPPYRQHDLARLRR